MYWEYYVYIIQGKQDRDALIDVLDSLGKERWELVSVVYDSLNARFNYYFKRELLEEIR